MMKKSYKKYHTSSMCFLQDYWRPTCSLIANILLKWKTIFKVDIPWVRYFSFIKKRDVCYSTSLWVGWIVLWAHMRGWSAGLEAFTDPVLMFNSCLRAWYAYYRLVLATVASKTVWCMDGDVYSVLLDLNWTTNTNHSSWCSWHNVGCSDVSKFDLLEFLWVCNLLLLL